MQLVFMSACLQGYHHRPKNTNKQANKPHHRRHCFSKLKCHEFLWETSNLYILSDSYTSKIMLSTNNVRFGEIFNASKKT